jgi:hypothetical protein
MQITGLHEIPYMLKSEYKRQTYICSYYLLYKTLKISKPTIMAGLTICIQEAENVTESLKGIE